MATVFPLYACASEQEPFCILDYASTIVLQSQKRSHFYSSMKRSILVKKKCYYHKSYKDQFLGLHLFQKACETIVVQDCSSHYTPYCALSININHWPFVALERATAKAKHHKFLFGINAGFFFVEINFDAHAECIKSCLHSHICRLTQMWNDRPAALSLQQNVFCSVFWRSYQMKSKHLTINFLVEQLSIADY